MNSLAKLLESNKNWATAFKKEHPEFFPELAKGQSPQYLWIGCSDSRMPPSVITDSNPGEFFVHRNIANQIIHTDLNCLSVLQYAVEVLKVKHIIVCGHYGCGGVQAAMSNDDFGQLNNWIRHLKELYNEHQYHIDSLADEDAKFKQLCEQNVFKQVANVCHTDIVQRAWKNGQSIAVHGLIYNLESGRLRELVPTVEGPDIISHVFRMK